MGLGWKQSGYGSGAKILKTPEPEPTNGKYQHWLEVKFTQ